MGKNELREKLSGIISNRKAITVFGVVALALILAVGILVAMSSFSTKEKEQVVSNDTDAVVQETAVEVAEEPAREKQEADNPADEVAEVSEETEEVLDYAAVIIVSINPKVKIYVDAEGIVLKMEKMNADAEEILAEIDWKDMKLDDCFDTLLVKAHEKGFLKDNAKVSITVAEAKKEMNISSMTQGMEKVAEEICKEMKIDIKLAVESADTEETMVKEIVGNTTDTNSENTILPTDTEEPEITEESTEETSENETSNDSSSNTDSNNNNSSNSGSTGNTPSNPPVVQDEYTLVWEDNFNGTELNRDDWNVELHDPGWVNEEWQEYVDSEENIYLKDGKLVLQAIETINDDGSKYYTSGRVNTQNKHDFKYGKFEAKIKVPSGMGFLPAFWMMPTDEQYYGQWPKCGEIDIMEVMGQSTDTLHGTIHYGDPHGQKQGTYVLDSSEADFAEEFHVYTCEWEPGKITWYVDGVKYHEANDWYTKREGFDEVAYPAPFDQPFYMILNVAVGGSWVGNPDETTQFGDNAQMQVDYVRVYQKDSYDENVEKPAKEEVPDSVIGANLLANDDFTNAESMKDGSGWEFLTANGGVGSAQVVAVNGNNALKITTEDAGTVDYSIQIVQGPIALKQGNKYKVSFDAWADEARTMKALISAPDLNYIRYWGDQTVNLTTEKQTFTYEFDMTEAGDANSRFEMTFGNMGSIATVYIDNVKVEKTGSFEVAEDAKSVLPDGNYVYNSGFDIGSDRMKYWTVDSSVSGVNYLATNEDGVREFKVVVPNAVSSLEDIVLEQEDTAITGGKEYLFTFDAYGAEVKTIKAVISPKTASGNAEDLVYDVDVTTEKTEHKFTFTMPENVTGSDVKFLIGTAGTTYIDNVRVQEDANVINGNFSSGVAGWELYAYTPGDVEFAIDELDNGSGTPAAAINITKSGPVDWHIQLKQAVTLEQGKKYRISFDTWSTVERKFLFAIQRNPDKKGGGEWTSYSGDISETMSTTGFEHYSKEFNMTWETDDIAELKFTLGAVGGVEINTPHTVFIDNVVLEEIGTCSTPEIPEVEAGVNMFTNASFESGELEPWIIHAYGEGKATYEVKNNAVTVDVTSVGTADGMVSLQYKGLTLETGASYVLTFDAVSTESRAIKPCFMDPDNNYAWYGGTEVELEKDVVKSVEFPFTVDAASSNSVMLQVGMGLIGDSTAPSQITLSNFKLVKVEGEPSTPDEGGDTPTTPDTPSSPVEGNMFERGGFNAEDTAYVEGGSNVWDFWSAYAADASASLNGDTSYNDGCMTVSIAKEGDVAWGIQLKYAPKIALENGATYELKFDATSSVTRGIVSQFQDSANKTAGWNMSGLEAGVTKQVTVGFKYEGETSSDYNFVINMGKMDGADAIGALHTITFDNFSLVKVSDAQEQVAFTLNRPTTDIMVEEPTEETTEEETTSEEESTEEPSTDDPTQEPSGEEAIVETKSEDDEKAEE